MLRALDEHSSYLSSETYSKFFQDIEAAYGGIGAYVNVDPTDGIFTITRPDLLRPRLRGRPDLRRQDRAHRRLAHPG